MVNLQLQITQPNHVIIPEITEFPASGRCRHRERQPSYGVSLNSTAVNDALHNCKAILKASASYSCITFLLILFSYSTSSAYRNQTPQ
jgi:hypothetical protein